MLFSFTGLVEASAGAIGSGVSGLPITEFGIVLLVALVLGLILSRFGISSSIGFILTGLLLGSQGLNYISETGISNALGEIGLLAILFYLGLELNLRKFKETGGVAVVFAVVEMAGAFTVGFLVSQVFGFHLLESLIIGAMLVAASTVEAVKFMIEKNIMQSLEARIAVSILILQDIFAVLLVVFFSTLASSQSFNLAVFNALIFVVAMFFIVGKLSRPVFELLEKWGQQDKMFLFGLASGIVVAFLGAFLGLSPILGAYFAGFALAETGFAEKIKREFGFLRELFLLFFFVSFGSKVLLPTSANLILFIAVLVIAYILVKIISYGFFGAAIGLNVPSSVAIGAILLPIGEFGILIASTAEKLNTPGCSLAGTCVLSDSQGFLSAAFALAIVTTLIGPFVFERIDKAASLLLRLYPVRVREKIALVGDQVQGLETVFVTSAFQNQAVIILKNLIANLVIACSVVYLAFILRQQVTLSFLHFLPTELALTLALLPIIIWPVYNFAKEFKALIRYVQQTLTSAKKSKKKESNSVNSFDLIIGFLMTLMGVIATILIYSAFPTTFIAILVPVTYTVLSIYLLVNSTKQFLQPAK